MVTVMFIVIVIVIVIVQLLVFKRITLICEITLICVITLVCVILHVLKNTLKYSLNDALFFVVSSNHSHLPTLLYNPFTQYTINFHNIYITAVLRNYWYLLVVKTSQ